MIYYCNICEIYFHSDDVKGYMPDGEDMHTECMNDDYNELTESEIVDALNNEEIR
jgi:hypothetical protein